MFEDDEEKLKEKCSCEGGIPLIHCNHMLWNSSEDFAITRLYSDGEIKLNLCGIYLYKDFLRLKFYFFCMVAVEDVMDIYLQDLKVNDFLIVKLRNLAHLANGEYEDIYIDIPETEALSLKEIQSIDLRFVENLEKYDLQWSQEIQITCDVELQMYAANVGECKMVDLEDEENLLI